MEKTAGAVEKEGNKRFTALLRCFEVIAGNGMQLTVERLRICYTVSVIKHFLSARLLITPLGNASTAIVRALQMTDVHFIIFGCI